MVILEGHRNLPFIFSAVVGHRVFTTRIIFFSQNSVQNSGDDKIRVLFCLQYRDVKVFFQGCRNWNWLGAVKMLILILKKSHLKNHHLLNRLTLLQQHGNCSINEEFKLTNIQISLKISYTLFYCYMWYNFNSKWTKSFEKRINPYATV